jgi:plastocyanin
MRRKVAVLAAMFTLALAFAMGSVASAGACIPKAQQPQSGKGLAISVNECAFWPTILYVPIGSTITWTNNDFLPHGVAGAGWSTLADPWGVFEPGKSVTRAFSAPGIYEYMCHLHPGMTGIVVVGDVAFPGPDSAAAAPLTQVAPVATTAPLPTSAPARSTSAPVDLPIALALVIGAALGSLATARWPRLWRVAFPSWSA